MHKNLNPKSLTLACALALSAIAAGAQAADVQDQNTEKKAHVLDAVIVQDVMDQNGETTLTSVELDMVPLSTNTVSDAFRFKSFVQYDASSRNGAQGAEITPPAISIRGSRNYENAFLINGLSNNSVLNPSGYASSLNFQIAGNLMDKMPTGDAQAIMLDTDLLESLTILSENVSAEYGNFTGGVVNAQIRDAQMDRWHMKTWVRHTRDAWAKVHVTDTQDKIETPTDRNLTQKEFKKSKVGMIMEGPLLDGKLGAMLSYEKTHATAPVYAMTDSRTKVEEKSKRDKENLMLRVNTDKNADFYVSSSLIYSPYESNVFVERRHNGERQVEGDGLNWSINTVATLDFGQWANDISFARNTSGWYADTDTSYQWYYPNSSVKYYDGMQGDREMKQDTINFKSALTLNPIALGASEHKIKVGLEGLYLKAQYDIDGYTAYSYPNKTNPDSIVGDKSDGVIAGEQFATRKYVGHETHTEEDYFSIGAFLEDEMHIERFTFRPGVRIETDNITHNVNIAPRVFAEADILNDHRFFVNAGYNRYYGTQILSEAVSATQSKTRYDRKDLASGWVESSNEPDRGSLTKLDDLDTPYSDEYVLGASANVFDGTIFKIQGVYRDYKDQLTYENGKIENNGETNYKGISFAIEKAFDLGNYGKHYAEFGITHSKLKGNSTSWSDSWHHSSDVEAGGVNPDYVWLDGEKKSINDLPANNFNAEWVLTYTQRSFFFDDRLRSTVLVRYESGTDGIYWDRGEKHDGDPLPYACMYTFENDAVFNTDVTIEYDLIKTANSTLTLQLDALNLFDHESENEILKMPRMDTRTTSMGRQFFLGMTYTY